MPDRELLPIAIPHGKDGNFGLVSVYLMPRLGFGPKLSDFPDWSDWPAVVRAMTFTIRVNGAISAFSQISAPPSSPKWHAVFPGDLDVFGWFNIHREVTRVATYNQSNLASTV